MKSLMLAFALLILLTPLCHGYEQVLLEENSVWRYTFAYREGWKDLGYVPMWWSRGDSAFGNDPSRNQGFACDTEWPVWSTIYVRKYFTMPEGCQSVTAHIAIDNGYVLYINGSAVDSVFREGFPWKWQYTVGIPSDSLVTAPDSNLVCLKGVDWGQGTGFDMMIVADCPVTPVEGSFHGAATEFGTVRLRWAVESLAGIEGFDVLRATSPDGPFVQLNEEALAPTSPAEFEDATVWPETEFLYDLRARFADGSTDPVQGSPISVRTGGRLAVALYTPSPNPLMSATSLQFDVPSHVEPVKLAVYNVTGRRVRTLVDGPAERGRHSVVWDGTDDRGRPVSSGAYFVKLEVEGQTSSEKMVVTR